MKLQSLSLFFLGLFVLAGCRSSPPQDAATWSPQERVLRDSVLHVLTGMQRTAFDSAFVSLPLYRYTRSVAVEQFDAQGRPLATEVRVWRLTGLDPTSEIRHTTEGTFDFGWFGRFVGEPSLPPPEDLASYLLAEEPAFLAPRNRDAYRYRFGPDTTIAGLPVRVIEVEAHPVFGQEQRVRQARLYVQRETNELLALALTRHDDALLLEEESLYFISLRQVGPQAWVPALLRYDTLLRSPLHPPRRFRITTTFDAFQPLP